MRPSAIRQFEGFLFAGLAVDLVNNFLSWDAMAARFAAQGVAASPAMLIASCLLSTAVGLLFWYLIVRRRSRAAGWVMTVLVAAGAAGFVYKAADTGMSRMLALGLVGELLKVIAVSRLFAVEARQWLISRPSRASAA